MISPPPRLSPANLKTSTKTRFAVYVAPNGATMGDQYRSSEYEVLSVSISAGGQRPDSVKLFRRLDKTGRHKYRNLADDKPQEVEVWTLDAKGAKNQPVFWGEIDSRTLTIATGGEGEIVTACVRPHHFGEPLRGMQVWDDTGAGDTVTIDYDAEFQPLVDGKIIDNRIDVGAIINANFPDYSIWITPESQRTATGLSYHDLFITYSWDIEAIVRTLCGWLNADEDFIDNYDPTTGGLEDTPDVRNVRLKRGQYLPQLLDAVLPPYGYNWYLSYADNSGRVKPRINVYKRGEGTERKLFLPPLSGSANLSHNAERVDLTAELWRLANKVRCDGGVVERQVTIELYRAWEENDDSYTVEDLTKSTSSATGLAFGSIWRRWVWNEGGDYSGTRTTVAPIGDPPNLDSVFGSGNWVIRRRRAEPTLLWQDAEETRRRPVQVEWSDDAGATWQPIEPGWGVRVLDDEVGIIFTADKPPEEIVAAGDDALVRITCTILGDKRLTSTADRDATNPQTNDVEVVLDVSDQFNDRQFVASGDFASALGTVGDSVDDSTLIETYAETVRDLRKAISLQANITLFGLHHEYRIGDILTKIHGRWMSLDRLPGGGRYLQVVGADFDVQRHRTQLQVSPYDT